MHHHLSWAALTTVFLVVVAFPGAGVPACLAGITITSPNGGEVWVAGTTQTITWTRSFGLYGTASFYLLRGGDVNDYLGQADVFAEEFSCTICDLVGDEADYSIRVVCSDCDPPAPDESDSPFAITGSIPWPTLTVTSPGDGDSWAAGTTHRIAWDSTAPRGDVAVWLIRPGQPGVLLGQTRMTNGGLTWDIDPFLGDGSDYYVHLSWRDHCGPQIDANSSGSFAITDSRPLPTLTVTSPVGGEAWPADSVQSVAWDSNDPAGTVDIWLTAGASYYEYLGSAAMADGRFEWPILPCIPDGTDYRIVVRWSSADRTVEARSAAPFAVTGSLMPTFTITSPVAGTTWTAGTSHARTRTGGGTNGRGTASPGGTNHALLGPGPGAGGGLAWDIPPGVGNGTYTIRLAMGACAVETVSSSFSISGSVTPTLTLTGPAGGTNWTAGTLGTITWQSTGLTGLLDIYLPDDGLHESGHVAVPIADGSFTRPIPPTLVWPRDPNSTTVPGGVWIWSYDCGPLKYVRGQMIQISAGSALLGDRDVDGDVDLHDVAGFQAAFTGRGPMFLDSPADFFDFDPDGDVDVDDWDAMALGMTGP